MWSLSHLFKGKDHSLSSSLKGLADCRGWVNQKEPYEAPGMVPVDLTVEPLKEGIRFSLGNAYTESINAKIPAWFGVVSDKGAFHILSGRGSTEPFELPYASIITLNGQVMVKEKKKGFTETKIKETVSKRKSEPIPKGKEFRIEITYRPPANKKQLIKLGLVADKSESTEDPNLTLDLFNRIADAISDSTTRRPK